MSNKAILRIFYSKLGGLFKTTCMLFDPFTHTLFKTTCTLFDPFTHTHTMSNINNKSPLLDHCPCWFKWDNLKETFTPHKLLQCWQVAGCRCFAEHLFFFLSCSNTRWYLRRHSRYGLMTCSYACSLKIIHSILTSKSVAHYCVFFSGKISGGTAQLLENFSQYCFTFTLPVLQQNACPSTALNTNWLNTLTTKDECLSLWSIIKFLFIIFFFIVLRHWEILVTSNECEFKL